MSLRQKKIIELKGVNYEKVESGSLVRPSKQ